VGLADEFLKDVLEEEDHDGSAVVRPNAREVAAL